jgi:hypothetical protein
MQGFGQKNGQKSALFGHPEHPPKAASTILALTFAYL